LIPEYTDIETKFNMGKGIKDFHFMFRFAKKDNYFNYKKISVHTIIKNKDKIILDNDADYFTKVSHMNYITHIKNIYSHCFSLDSTKQQPSGFMHFDDSSVMINRINNKKIMKYGLECELVIVYGKYDVIRINKGMCSEVIDFSQMNN
jgi:guanylate kinase